MATQAQMVANRLNAQKSTGPRTAEGKAVASQNAVKHGLLAQKAVIVGEDPGEFEFYRGEMLGELAPAGAMESMLADPGEFEFYRGEMLGELAPAGAMESMLAERVVSLSWRLRRAERVQNEAFDALLAKDTASPLARLTQSLRPRGDCGAGAEESALGRVVVKDFAGGRVLDRLVMYERRIEHSLYRTMTELQRLRLMRELDPPIENPTRQGERWGKPQPTTPTPAMEQPTREGERWGKPQPTDTSLAVGNPTRQGERWGKPQPTTPTPAMEQATREGERWGKPQPTDTRRAVGNPTRQSECWGKPQPTIPTLAMEQATREGERWGEPQPTDTSLAVGNPTRQSGCWGEPQPTTALEKTTSEPACAGADDPSRQTNPIARDRDVENPARSEPVAGCAKQTVRQGKLVQFSRYESCPAKV